MSDEYEDLLAGMAQGSRRRGVKTGRPVTRMIVCRRSLNLTQEKYDIIKNYMDKYHVRFGWEVIYKALDLLAEKEL